MLRNLRLGWMLASALLLFSCCASGQEPSYRLKEIYVPQISQFTQEHPVAVQSFDLSPDGKTLAVEFGTREPDKTISTWVALWDVDRQRLAGAKQVEADKPDVEWYTDKIRFSPDGRMLLAITGPRLVALSFPELKVLYAFEDRVLPENIQNQMFIEGFSVAANRLAILKQYDHNSDHNSSLEVTIADLDSGVAIAHWSKPDFSESIALSPDAKLLALTIDPVAWGVRNIPAGEDNVFIVKPDSGEVVRALSSGSAEGNAEFVGDGGMLLTMPSIFAFGPRDAARVWDVGTGQLEQKFGYPKYGLRGGMSLSTDGKLLAVAAVWLNRMDVFFDRNNTRGGARLLIWSLHSGKIVSSSDELGEEYDLGGRPISLLLGGAWGGSPPVLVRMSASGNRLAAGGQKISVYSLEISSAQPGK